MRLEGRETLVDIKKRAKFGFAGVLHRRWQAKHAAGAGGYTESSRGEKAIVLVFGTRSREECQPRGALAARQSRPWSTPERIHFPMTIESYTGGYFQTNGYWLSTDHGELLIDAPQGVADWLTAQGANPTALLLTHLHYDHVVDAAAVQQRFDCEIYAHSRPDADLTLETVLKETIGWPFDLPPFTIGQLLAGTGNVEPLGAAGPNFEIHHVPGHSPDSLCYLLPGDELLFGGDVLFAGGIGRTDFPHGDGPLLLQGIEEKLLKLDDATRVLPGHGPQTTIGTERVSNPYLN